MYDGHNQLIPHTQGYYYSRIIIIIIIIRIVREWILWLYILRIYSVAWVTFTFLIRSSSNIRSPPLPCMPASELCSNGMPPLVEYPHQRCAFFGILIPPSEDYLIYSRNSYDFSGPSDASLSLLKGSHITEECQEFTNIYHIYCTILFYMCGWVATTQGMTIVM